MTVIIIIGIIIGFFWLVKKIGTTNSYNQTNYNSSYRDGNTYQNNSLEELFKDLTLQQRYAFMLVYLFISGTDSTQRIYKNVRANHIIDKACRLLRVTVEETISYMRTLDPQKYLSTLPYGQNRTLTDCLLVDYLELSNLIENEQDRRKAFGVIFDTYKVLGYTENEFKSTVEAIKAVVKEFC